jgi:hypothetical protein
VDDVRAGSEWLAALERAEEKIAHPPTISIYTQNDDIIYPVESSQLAWAENIALDGIGHMGMLFSRPVATCVVDRLRQ